jgi:hypothetical protein
MSLSTLARVMPFKAVMRAKVGLAVHEAECVGLVTVHVVHEALEVVPAVPLGGTFRHVQFGPLGPWPAGQASGRFLQAIQHKD